MKGWKQIFQASGQEKNSGVATLISNKTDFKKKGHKKRPRDHFVILKGRIHQEDINFVNIYAPNIGEPNHTYRKSWRTSRKILTATQL